MAMSLTDANSSIRIGRVESLEERGRRRTATWGRVSIFMVPTIASSRRRIESFEGDTLRIRRAKRFSRQKGSIRAHRVGIGVSVEDLCFEVGSPIGCCPEGAMCYDDE